MPKNNDASGGHDGEKKKLGRVPRCGRLRLLHFLRRGFAGRASLRWGLRASLRLLALYGKNGIAHRDIKLVQFLADVGPSSKILVNDVPFTQQQSGQTTAHVHISAEKPRDRRGLSIAKNSRR